MTVFEKSLPPSAGDNLQPGAVFLQVLVTLVSGTETWRVDRTALARAWTPVTMAEQ